MNYSNDELRGILESMGCDTAGMSVDEMESLMTVMLESHEESGTQDNTTPDVNTAMCMTDSQLNAVLGTSVFKDNDDINEKAVAAPDAAVGTQVFSREELDTINASHLERTANAAATDTLDDEQQEKIAMYCAITGSEDVSLARQILEATNWDVDVAMTIFFDQDAVPSAAVDMQPTVVRPPLAPLQHAGLAVDVSTDAVNDMQKLAGVLREIAQQQTRAPFHGTHDYFNESEDLNMPDSPPRKQNDEFDEYGVRRPDAVRSRQLLHTRSVDLDETVLGRAEDPDVDWMFMLPNDIVFPGTLEQARECATEEKKLVLVNIQSHNEFSSQLLNRDVWSNDIVRAALSNYVFWQRGHTTSHAQKFMSLYKVVEADLPQIFVIDPTTGAKLLTLTGMIEPEVLATQLVEFYDRKESKRAKFSAPVRSEAVPIEIERKEVENEPAPAPAPAPVPVAPEMPARPEVATMFGLVPVPPADTDAEAIKIAIKLENGKMINRKYAKSDLVKCLFAVVLEQYPDCAEKPFDLISRFPAKTLSMCLDETLGESGLAGGQVFQRLF